MLTMTQKDHQDINAIQSKIKSCFDDYDAYRNDALRAILKLIRKTHLTDLDIKMYAADSLDEFAIGRETAIKRLQDTIDEIRENYDLNRLDQIDHKDYYYQAVQPATNGKSNYINIVEDDLVKTIVNRLQDVLIDDENARLALNYYIIADGGLPFDSVVFPYLKEAYAEDNIQVIRTLDKSSLHKMTHIVL